MKTSPSERCPTCGRKAKRSTGANSLYWLLLHELADNCKPGGMSYSAETWHIYFKKRYIGHDEVVLPNRQTLLIPRSTAKLDAAEFSDYFERVQAWAAERGVYLDSLEAA